MLRAASAICIDSQAFELLSKKDVFKYFRLRRYATKSSCTISITSNATSASTATKTVLICDQKAKTSTSATSVLPPSTVVAPVTSLQPPLSRSSSTSSDSPPRPPPSQPSSKTWTLAAAALITASVGGIFFYRKVNENEKRKELELKTPTSMKLKHPPVPSDGKLFPKHVNYLLIGGGTASFAALRALRANRPEAKVLVIGDEYMLPYMRPPLSKELWREPNLANAMESPDTLTFRQWNGRRRSVVYEPSVFYTPVEELESIERGAVSTTKGWSVRKVDVAKHEAEVAEGDDVVTITYDKALIATGVRAARIPELRSVAAAGRSYALRSLQDVVTLAGALDDPKVKRVAILGGGFLATELSAALVDRLRIAGKSVVQVCIEPAPMAGVLPEYLARDTALRLAESGVQLVCDAEVREAKIRKSDDRVELRLSSGATLDVDLVVECAGSVPNIEIAEKSGLEIDKERGGILVNAELQARTDVYAAGDVACFHDIALGRRRVEHHDHAVVSGRLAGENMALVKPPKHYEHQSMFWSDLGPDLGYEAIGIIDARLPTVGVFSADAITQISNENAVQAADANVQQIQIQQTETNHRQNTEHRQDKEVALLKSEDSKTSTDVKRYEKGVVFYLREKRVVGVLMWNLFNKMHTARQVVTRGEFEDLFEVAKLFQVNEEEEE